VRFLLATIDGGGTVPPELGLASRLVRRGHAVRVLADPTVEPGAHAARCAFSSWRRAPHVRSVEEQTALIADMERRNVFRQFVFARDRIICGPAKEFAADVVETVREDPVDAVLAEAAIAGILVGAEATRLPVAALMPNIYLRPAPGRPPFGTGWAPARGRAGRIRDAVATEAIRRLLATGLPAVNTACRAYHLPPVGGLYELLARCTRVLVMTSPAFDFRPATLPPNVRYVGPQLDDPPWAGRGDWRPGGTGPLVLVAMSSGFQDQAGALRRIAAALRRLPVAPSSPPGWRSLRRTSQHRPMSGSFARHRTARCWPRLTRWSPTPVTEPCSKRSPRASRWSACRLAVIKRTTPRASCTWVPAFGSASGRASARSARRSKTC
jgi:hypothetical protein